MKKVWDKKLKKIVELTEEQSAESQKAAGTDASAEKSSKEGKTAAKK